MTFRARPLAAWKRDDVEEFWAALNTAEGVPAAHQLESEDFASATWKRLTTRRARLSPPTLLREPLRNSRLFSCRKAVGAVKVANVTVSSPADPGLSEARDCRLL